MNRQLVARQPVIPEGVNDIFIGKEYHKGGHYWVFFIHSEGDGVKRWRKERLEEWGMPKSMVDTSTPYGIEYYRDICPFGEEGANYLLVRDPKDGLWYWMESANVQTP